MYVNDAVTAAETTAWKAAEIISVGAGSGGAVAVVFLWIFFLGISCYEIGMRMRLWNPLFLVVTVLRLCL